MNTNDKVYWRDPINRKLMTGTLLEKTIVIAEVDADKFMMGAKIKDVPEREEWDIKGDDGKQYTFPEKDLFLLN